MSASFPAADRAELLALLGEVGLASSAPTVLSLVGENEPTAVQLAALMAWQRLGRDEQAETLIATYPRLAAGVKAGSRTVLLSKRRRPRPCFRAVDDGRIPANDLTIDELRDVRAFSPNSMPSSGSTGDRRARDTGKPTADVRRLNNDLRRGTGDSAAGRVIFTKHCATCHRLFGEGGAVGPDLTHANRADRNYLLVSVVDPSSVIRREYVSYRLETKDGRVLTGVIAEQSPARVTLLDARGERTDVPRGEIATLDESPCR